MSCKRTPKSLAILLLVLFTQIALGQKGQKLADLHYQKKEYALAIKAYKDVLKTQQPSLEVVTKLADAYRQLNNPQDAEFWYAQMLAFPNYDPQHLKHFADMARMNGDFKKAKNLYLTYAEKVPSAQHEAMNLIATSENAQLWMAQPQPYAVEKHPQLNSENSDFSPAFYQEGIVFTSDRYGNDKKRKVSAFTGKPYSALYYSKKEDSGFSSAVPLPAPIHNDVQNGSAVFSPDGNTIYFTRINHVKQKKKKVNTDPFSWTKFSSTPNYINRLELFISQKQANGWSKPKPFPYNNPSLYSIGHPALSVTGDTLYFASDMPGSLGESDIFFSVKQHNNAWSAPTNLGQQVNTEGKEVFPVISPSGKLYFSSNGHKGMGGLDIFSANGSGVIWSQAKNLRYPLNSPADDFGILFEKAGDSGYLSSNRGSTDGTDDIFSFKYAPIPCHLSGIALEKAEIKPGLFKDVPVANVKISLYKEGDTVPVITYSNAAGQFTFAIFDGVGYKVRATKTGYLNRTATITPACESTVDMVKLGMVLNRNTLNTPILVENIYYDLDKYDIRPDAALELDKLVQTLNDNPNINIELSSHTDSRQTRSYNNLLSQMRAQAAVDYIVSKGVDRSRISAKGYGETRLLNRCADGVACSEEEHQLNRRTEFKILKIE
ncbi:OmpA family protein [Rufibacter roseus]|uniref:OmpA family protein n=1 Tax=Rufibacter roseus TaxID=1567108 RepID=A0ABW2DL43_9BACT|nr:OmpA family protein [Rufibacter roseus]